jgi:uncharacterized protein (DUF2062 family)
MEPITIIYLLTLHFIGDFILQSNYVASNKSKDNLVLLQHVIIYGLPLLLISFKFAVINLILHFLVDYVTSRITATLWQQRRIHYFFVTIGFDQLLHAISLILTYQWLIK